MLTQNDRSDKIDRLSEQDIVDLLCVGLLGILKEAEQEQAKLLQQGKLLCFGDILEPLFVNHLEFYPNKHGSLIEAHVCLEEPYRIYFVEAGVTYLTLWLLLGTDFNIGHLPLFLGIELLHDDVLIRVLKMMDRIHL